MRIVDNANRSTFRGVSVLAVALMAFVTACADGGGKSDAAKDAAVKDGSDEVPPECRLLPTIQQCTPPSDSTACKHYKCPCRGCAAQTRTAACDVATGDCRFFCSTCLPQGYQPCNNPRKIIAKCGECYDKDKDEFLPHCDRLKQDAGTDADASSSTDADADAD